MHTNILINSNFESFNNAHTIHMYAQSDRWVLRFCFYSRKNMSTLHSQHNAYIHNCKSPDTHTNHDYGYENFELQLGANVRVVPKIVISLNKMKWIQIRIRTRTRIYIVRMLFTLHSVSSFEWLFACALFHSHLSLDDIRSKFSPAALYVVYVCNTNEMK